MTRLSLTARIGRNRGDILNTTNLHTVTGKGTKGGLSTGTGGGGTSTTSSTQLDVKSGNTNLLKELSRGRAAKYLKSGSDILSGKHGSVGGGLITISLDSHTSGNSDESFTTSKIGDVDESIVERGEDVGNSENFLTLLDVLRTKLNNFLFLLFLLGSLVMHMNPRHERRAYHFIY